MILYSLQRHIVVKTQRRQGKTPSRLRVVLVAGEERKTNKGHFAVPMGQGVSVFNTCKDATCRANVSIVEIHMDQKMQQ